MTILLDELIINYFHRRIDGLNLFNLSHFSLPMMESSFRQRRATRSRLFSDLFCGFVVVVAAVGWFE